MTAWNSARYLREAIDSILQQQTKREWELLFVDDGSTDATLRIAEEYALLFPSRIHVLQHPRGVNRGISASRNLALRHARGHLLAFLDSDDVWLAHHLETQARLLDKMPQVAMVYAGAERWVDFNRSFQEEDARAAFWGENYLPPLVPPQAQAGLLPRGALLEWFRQDESYVPCICTVMARTHIVREVGGFCNNFKGLYDDQVLHARLSRYDIYANDTCVARYRQHPSSCCARARTTPNEHEIESSRFEAFLCGSVS